MISTFTILLYIYIIYIYILHLPSLSLHIVKLDLRVPSRPTTSDFDTADNAELNKTKLVMCAHAGGAG